MNKLVKYYFSVIAVIVANLLYAKFSIAADSYRYMHVSIDTPWLIFVFLLLIILFPFVLSAILYWYFTIKKHKEEKEQQTNAESSTEESQ